MKLQQVSDLQDNVDTQIETIDLTEASSWLSVWDYEERVEIQTFSDMMLDYMKVNGITDYKANEFYAEYVPELKFIVNEVIAEHDEYFDWEEHFAKQGFVWEKIRTAHIIDKKSKEIVAKVKYIGGDDHDSLLRDAFLMTFTRIYPVDPFLTDITYFHHQLNFAFKNRHKYFGEDEEIIINSRLNSRILNLFGYPFNDKKLKIYPLDADLEIGSGGTSVTHLVASMDFPTGVFSVIYLNCYGEVEWIFNPAEFE